MAPRDWRKAADYADLADLDLSSLAWEFLRRNPLYQLEHAGLALAPEGSGHSVSPRWGLRFPAPPSLDAEQAPVFWTAQAAPAHVVVLARSTTLEGVTGEGLAARSGARRHAGEGVHLRVRDGLQLLIPSDVGFRTPLAAEAALDGELPVRLSALGALERLLHAKPAGSGVLPLLSRRRSVLMLRTLDGRGGGASYRDIAEQVLGEAPAAGAWRTSSVRDVAIRLCRSARRMMGGGYRALLRRRR